MRFSPRLCRLAGCCVLSISIVLLEALPAFTQGSPPERSFPTHGNPKVVVSNASNILIYTWAKNEVSVTAETTGSAVKAEEVIIKAESNKLDISCRPSKPDRNISISLRVPAKASLEIKSYSNKVEVTDPTGQLTIIAGKEYLFLNVPESSSLDMRLAPNASEHRELGRGGFARIGIGTRQSGGKGPPFVKVTAEKTQVTVAHGFVGPGTSSAPFTPPPKPLTIAATTIARRNSSMARALGKSSPQLIRPQRDKDKADNSPETAEEDALKTQDPPHQLECQRDRQRREGATWTHPERLQHLRRRRASTNIILFAGTIAIQPRPSH